MTSPEPRFARIAAMIGDPTRARMLSALMGGQYLAAGELAAAAGVSAQTASTHITKLLDSELVALRVQGRHRYLRLADAEIAHALEALSLVAERGAASAKWEQGAYKPLKAARTCYSHLAGELGVALFDGHGQALRVCLPRLVRAPRPPRRWPGDRAARPCGDAGLAAAHTGIARADADAAGRERARAVGGCRAVQLNNVR
jgi:DNA-binding transcriptional ArsR family regulator